MAEHREPSDTERLLAEVDGMLSGRPAALPARVTTGDGSPGGLRGRLRGALVVGAVAGAGVWVLFAVLPFLRATSGGLGALLGATAAALIFRRRRGA
jgi:hypothetical protein